MLLLTYLAVMGTLALRARDATRADDVERRVVGRAVLVTVPLLMLIDVIETYFSTVVRLPFSGLSSG